MTIPPEVRPYCASMFVLITLNSATEPLHTTPWERAPLEKGEGSISAPSIVDSSSPTICPEIFPSCVPPSKPGTVLKKSAAFRMPPETSMGRFSTSLISVCTAACSGVIKGETISTTETVVVVAPTLSSKSSATSPLKAITTLVRTLS